MQFPSTKFTSEANKCRSYNKQEWSNIIDLFDDANIYQTWSYGKVRWGDKSLHHVAYYDRDRIRAAAQVIIKKIPFIKLGVAYIPWGPLWCRKDEKKTIDNFYNIIKKIKNNFGKKGGLLVRIGSKEIETEKNDTIAALNELGFSIIRTKPKQRTLIVDIRPPLEKIRASFKPKWRNMLNQSEKKGINIQKGVSDKLFADYLFLQNEMVKRKGFVPGVNPDEFRSIQNDLFHSQKMKIIIAYKDNNPISAAVCSSTGNTGIYLLGATGNEGLKYRGAYLIQWEMIKWLKEDGCIYYDLGGISPETNPGVYHFKSGISGKIPIDVHRIGDFYFCNSTNKRILISTIERIFKQ